MSQSDDIQFEYLDQLLLGEAPAWSGGKTEVGNTAVTPALLAVEFVIKDATAFELFQRWLHSSGLYPRTIGDEELPTEALVRDLKVAVNGLLVIEDAAQQIQAAIDQQSGAQGGKVR